MKVYTFFVIILVGSDYKPVNGIGLEVFLGGQPVAFLPPLQVRLPDSPNLTRDRSRYRHNYPINPLTRNANNNHTFVPALWDLASGSYPVDFFLYTKDNPYLPEELTVNNASDSKFFDRSKPTKIIIHDFMQSSEILQIHDLKDAYMNKKGEYNVLLVDWEPARTYTYTVAVTVSEYVGKMTARIAQVLKMDGSKTHIIGFGLGAHAAGVMGNDLKQFHNMTLARITGLDPSLPLFRLAGNYFKLDTEDATFVDVIHTDGGDNLWNSNHLGMGQEIGHVDVYPNRGIFQPGCRQSSSPNYNALQCSHRRALEIYKESIQDEMSFVACRCPSWADFSESRCDCMHESNRIFVGEATPPTARQGNYYMVTSEASPYGLGGKGALPDLTRAADPGLAVQNLFSLNGTIFQGIGQIANIFTAPVKPFFNSLVRNAQALNDIGSNLGRNLNNFTRGLNNNFNFSNNFNVNNINSNLNSLSENLNNLNNLFNGNSNRNNFNNINNNNFNNANNFENSNNFNNANSNIETSNNFNIANNNFENSNNFDNNVNNNFENSNRFNNANNNFGNTNNFNNANNNFDGFDNPDNRNNLFIPNHAAPNATQPINTNFNFNNYPVGGNPGLQAPNGMEPSVALNPPNY